MVGEGDRGEGGGGDSINCLLNFEGVSCLAVTISHTSGACDTCVPSFRFMGRGASTTYNIVCTWSSARTSPFFFQFSYSATLKASVGGSICVVSSFFVNVWIRHSGIIGYYLFKGEIMMMWNLESFSFSVIDEMKMKAKMINGMVRKLACHAAITA